LIALPRAARRSARERRWVS